MLRFIAVVDIPIYDQNPLKRELVDGISGTDGNIVEEAKPHGQVAGRMMARRAAEREGRFDLAVHDRVDRADGGARREVRGLVVDFDVHHGNGTQDIFYESPNVFYFSTHRYPFYPGSGHWRDIGMCAGTGYTMNVPLPHSVGDSMYARIFDDLLYPAAERYKPQLVLVSAGYDAHFLDPLGALMLLTSEGYGYMTRVLRSIAHDFADDRLVLLLEGGYHLEALAASATATAHALLNEEDPPDPLGKPARPERDIGDLVEHLRGVHRLV